MLRLALLTTSASVLAGDLARANSEEIFIFAGRRSPVPVTIRNQGAGQRTAEIGWRLFQASAAAVAPAGNPVSLGERQFEAGASTIITAPVEPPPVRAITQFILKVSAGEEELAPIRLTVCPTNIFSGLKGAGIAVQEPDSLLERLLPSRRSDAPSQLSIVRLPNSKTRWNNKELAPGGLVHRWARRKGFRTAYASEVRPWRRI